MRKLTILVLVTCLSVLVWLLLLRKGATSIGAPDSASAGQQVAAKPPINNQASAASTVSGMLRGKYPRWEGGRSIGLNDPRWEVVRTREKIDRAWQGKMPIDFFGKVVDADDRPVEGATVRFSWTDLSAAGSTQATTKSDPSGMFSLIGATGKSLGVQVEKEGYYTSKLNRYGFEFASFSSQDFYQPDPSGPVHFRLRKKQAADALLHREQEVKVAVGQHSEVSVGDAKLYIELLNNPKPKEGVWSMRLSVSKGGVQTTSEEFPFAAPSDGYQPSLIIDDHTAKPPMWMELYEGGTFYLKSGENYGRVEIQMISGKDWIRVKTWLNPSGGRNLEYDSAKSINP